MPETVIVALIVGFMSLPGIVLAYLTFMQTRRTLPQQTAAIEATTEQDKAETNTIDIRNYDTLYGMYKEMSFDMVKVLEKQRRQEIDLNLQAAEITDLKGQLGKAENSAAEYKGLYEELKFRTSDYPRRLELAELKIGQLEAIILQKDEQAAKTLDARLSDSHARADTAATAKIAAEATPPTAKPAVTPDTPAGSITITIPADTSLKTVDDTTAVVSEASPPPGEPGSD